MCPWHGWEYSVVTGHGPEGYDEEQVPVFDVEERADGVYVATPPRVPRKLVKHKPLHLLDEHPKPAGAPPRVLGISTTAMDDANPRFSTSDALLEHALAHARDTSPPTRSASACASSPSATAKATTRRRRAPAPGPAPSPSAIPSDQLTAVYEGLVHWADVVLVATPIRWGNASSLYFKMVERLNCIQNQITIAQPRPDPEQGRRLHHHRRPGQRAGGRRAAADLLGGARLRRSAVSRSSRTRAAGTPRTWRTTCAR